MTEQTIQTIDPSLIHQQPAILDLLMRGFPRWLDCSKLSLEEAERLGELISTLARDVGFWLGDLARYSEPRWPETHQQVWPVFQSPGQLARNAAVCRAYPTPKEREHECTFTQFMQVASKPDRQTLLAEMVGLTTDETRKKPEEPKDDRPRWLLCIDCNYFLHRFFYSGAGLESAVGVASWVKRTVERLKEKGLTDVACCFDNHVNHRKELTKDWEDKYKDRKDKEHELVQQIALLHDLIQKDGFTAITIEGMEADDVMASYARQFQGKVTLLTQDKDQRQCLSGKCNILLDVEWVQDEHSAEHMPVYKWLSAKEHFEKTGIKPEQWADYQAIMGDNCDNITGVSGIGEKGAADLIKQFGTLEAVIQAAKAGDDSIKPKKREALIAFEPKLEITRKLVTLRNDLEVPSSTRLT